MDGCLAEKAIAEAVISERQACWDAINSKIKNSELKGDGFDEIAERNGLIYATNIIMDRGAIKGKTS